MIKKLQPSICPAALSSWSFVTERKACLLQRNQHAYRKIIFKKLSGEILASKSKWMTNSISIINKTAFSQYKRSLRQYK